VNCFFGVERMINNSFKKKKYVFCNYPFISNNAFIKELLPELLDPVNKVIGEILKEVSSLKIRKLETEKWLI
jgi:Ni,Fe-hydrogenase maturation factor